MNEQTIVVEQQQQQLDQQKKMALAHRCNQKLGVHSTESERC